MDVILLERIAKLGNLGDVVHVKPGYARNYLLPQRKALRATEANKAYFEREKAALEAANEAKRSEAGEVSTALDGQFFVLIRQAGESGQLYGSVTARDIATIATDKGYPITRQQVVIDRPIKELGLHDIEVRLHPEVTVTVTANVALTEDEAETQAARGLRVGDEPPEEVAAPAPVEAPPVEETEEASAETEETTGGEETGETDEGKPEA
ncbi:MAG: 50S ribosomal protein L9 [Alphaproteobacteria bacterium]